MKRERVTPTAAVPLARSLARPLANNNADRDDLVQDGLFALHQIPQRDLTKAERPWGMAQQIIRRAMLNTVRRETKLRQRRVPLTVIGTRIDYRPPVGEQVELLDYYEQLQQRYGVTARRVAENLVEPNDVGCCKALLADVQRKRKRCGARNTGTRQPVRMLHRHIREGLGLTQSEWRRTITKVRAFTRDYCTSS